jgi:hypothetical protein
MFAYGVCVQIEARLTITELEREEPIKKKM